MKRFNNKELQLRAFAAVAESILFYIGFLAVNQVAGGSHINILFFILTALCGLFIHFFPYNNFKKVRESFVFGVVGLALAVLSIGISAIKGFNLFALPVGFIALIFLYYRSCTSYISSVLYVYTAENFYQSMAFLLAVNVAAAFWARSFSIISQELMRYSVLYIIMALYMLSEVKNFRYVSKNENSRKTVFDIAATSLIIIVTLIMSVPKVLETVTYPLAWVFKIVYGGMVKVILLVLNPIARGINYLFDLIERPNQLGASKPGYGDMLDMSKKYNQSLNDVSSPLIQLIGKVLTFAFMLMLCVFAVYMLFRFINKAEKNEQEEDFTEDKVFMLRGRKDKAPGLLSRLAGSVKKVTGSIAFKLTANNGEKVRSEYRSFVQRLHSKKIIEKDNCTAQDILQLLLCRIPEQENDLASVTAMYEEVRYGVRCPEDEELRSFRRGIAEISRNLQQISG